MKSAPTTARDNLGSISLCAASEKGKTESVAEINGNKLNLQKNRNEKIDTSSSILAGCGRSRMRHDYVADLNNALGQVRIISTDVFDTLLLRNSRSERSRIVISERLFANRLAELGWKIDPDVLVDTRLQIQRLAFRGLSLRESGEVRLVDIIERQLILLGLPHSLVAERVRFELETEKGSLVANKQLGDILRTHRRSGTRIIAVSDTTLSAEAVRELISHFHGPDLVDKVYSSADLGSTKRGGNLFEIVAQTEGVPPSQIAHIGDDLHADFKVPSIKGITTVFAPRHGFHRYLRLMNAALTQTQRLTRARSRAAQISLPSYESAFSFGRDILGPIVVEFCTSIWLYATEAEAKNKAVLMFCARGGVGIREAFERVIEKFGLPLNMRRENIMISRLIAARAALLVRSHSAVEELNREFRGSLLYNVADALGGRNYQLPEHWHKPFDAETFVELLFGGSGVEVLTDIERQNALFTLHLKSLARDANRIILCDTGLYGSTQRLLASAFPEMQIETIQFARANYKRHSEEHFPKVTGLLVQQNVYSPLTPQSCVLRYWHLIESLFEPAIQSVRVFSRDVQGRITANCGNIDFGFVDPSEKNRLLSGALEYIDVLPAANGNSVAIRDAGAAWHFLKRAITRPSRAELHCLEVGNRSIDFGRADVRQSVAQNSDQTLFSKLVSIKSQLWREGAIARQFPLFKFALLPLLATLQSLRGLLTRQH